jgi:hypothetical protein
MYMYIYTLMSGWLDLSDNANCFKQTYVQGFVDISGGSIITRNSTDGLIICGDSSLNGTVYLGDSMYVRSNGIFPGTAENGATSIYVDASYVGQPDVVGVAKPDITGGPDVAGSNVNTFLQADASWSQLGFDIDGEAAGDWSGQSVSLINSDTHGRVVAIGAPYNHGPDVSSNTGDNRGHVRVYQYKQYIHADMSNNYHSASRLQNATQTKPLIITGDTFSEPVEGTYYWTQLGADIDGEATFDYSGRPVSLVDSANGPVVAIGANNNDGIVASRTFKVRSDGFNYTIDGFAGNFPAITLQISTVYYFDVSEVSSEHPFALRLSDGDTTAVPGTDNNDAAGGRHQGSTNTIIQYTPDSTGTIVYQCVNHSSMIGTINIISSDNRGHVRVYRYDANKITAQTDKSLANYGPIGWNRLGADIDGEAQYDYTCDSLSLVDSADGLVVAIGAQANVGNRGHVRVYQYDVSKTNLITEESSPDFGPIGWRRLGADIDGEASVDQSGSSISLVDSATNGFVIAIGAVNNNGTNTGNTSDNRGHVRVYQYDASKNTAILTDGSANFGPIGWNRLGADIDGEASGDQSGYLVSLVDSAIGLVVAIGARQNDGTTASDDRGHVRVYQYDASKTDAILTDGSANFGPIGWNRLGGDIDGEAAGDYSGHSVSLVDTANGIVVAIGAYANSGAVGHVRVYQYDASKNNLITEESSPDFGPIGWRRLGADIDGEASGDQSGWSVSLVDSANGPVVAIGANVNDSTDSTGSRYGHVRIYEIPYTKTYSDVSGGYYDVSIFGGYNNDGKTTAALYVNGDIDISGGLTASTMMFKNTDSTNGSAIGEISFIAKTAITGNPEREYARIGATIRNNASGDVDGSISLQARVNDVLTEVMRINGADNQIEALQTIDLGISASLISSAGNVNISSTTGNVNITATGDNIALTAETLLMTTPAISLVGVLTTTVVGATAMVINSTAAIAPMKNFLKLKLNGDDIWIPYSRVDPSV